MTTEVLFPKIGFSMNEGVLSEWLVSDGGSVSEGQPLFSLESEKAVEEIPSPASGRLKILAPIGETYQVGAVLGVIE
jgi:pyruvate/2-oxoglutarate dehydrogenase complex dihydrolipoamide acyltransferase (E2) component